MADVVLDKDGEYLYYNIRQDILTTMLVGLFDGKSEEEVTANRKKLTKQANALIAECQKENGLSIRVAEEINSNLIAKVENQPNIELVELTALRKAMIKQYYAVRKEIK